MKVDIIIPNYNGALLYENNLPFVIKSIEKYKGKIIIVDDGSTDNDNLQLSEIVKKYSKLYPYIELYFHDSNKGFSSAVNTGVSKSKADYVVLLNSDVKPNNDFLVSPLEHLEKDKEIFGVGCMDKSIEGDEIVLRGRGVGWWEKGFVRHRKGEVVKSDTFWVSGGSSVFQRQAYIRLGGMDEIYNPFYWEDIDLSYRACKAGYRIIFDNNSIVEHYHEEGSIKKNFTQNRVNAISYRNQLIFIWKNITDIKLLFEHFSYLCILLFKSVVNGNTNFIKGLFLALRLLPVIIKKRHIQTKQYKLSDQFLLNLSHAKN